MKLIMMKYIIVAILLLNIGNAMENKANYNNDYINEVNNLRDQINARNDK